MGSESALWDMVRGTWTPHMRLVRIENRLELGTPDVYYNAIGRNGWLELKHVPAWPARKTTKVVIDHLTLEQITWAEAELKAGGRMWYLLQAERTYLLLTPAVAREIYEGSLTSAEIIERATVRDEGSLTKRMIKWLRS